MPPSVHHVEVERRHDGLAVGWSFAPGAAEAGSVLVGVGTSPESIDHAHHVEVSASDGSVVLRDLPGGRIYVSVAPAGGGSAVVAAERLLPFEGVRNFRDLGGYRTASGATTRWGRVFRADGLHHMTEGDLAAYHELGLRVVFDLRGDEERDRNPDPVASRHLPVITRQLTDATEWAALQRAEDGERWLRDLYVSMLDTSGPMFGEVLRSLAGPDGLPAMFHCAAGKDRTGLTAALLLRWLGVPVETVLDDYEQVPDWSGLDRERELHTQLTGIGVGAEAAAAFLGAPRAAMAHALTELDDRHSGVETYLRGPAALDDATLSALRTALLDP